MRNVHKFLLTLTLATALFPILGVRPPRPQPSCNVQTQRCDYRPGRLHPIPPPAPRR
jgi:hypothetical protein